MIDIDRKNIEAIELDKVCIFKDCGNTKRWYVLKDGSKVCAKCGAHYW